MASSTDSAKEWLVRTAANELTGPFTRETLIEKITSGTLTPEDEICRANHYWIYLDERDEVKNQLGIEVPKYRRKKGNRDDDEITETQTERIDASDVGAILSHDQERKAAEQNAEEREAYESFQAAHSDEIPDLGTDVGSESDHTAMLTNRALREFRPAKQNTTRSTPLTHVMGDSVPRPGMERPLFWRVVTLVMVIMAGVLIGWTLSVLQTRN